jgi:hypothetical protein
MRDLGRIDIEEIAIALVDRTDYKHRWLIDPRTGQWVLMPASGTRRPATGRIRRLTGNQALG